jgi:hypothetical protein
LVHFFWIISSDPKSAQNSGLFDTHIDLFRGITFFTFRRVFCDFLTRKYEIRITKDENLEKVFTIWVLEFQSLFKNGWMILIFKKRSKSLHPRTHRGLWSIQIRNAEHIITILKHEATEPVSLNCYCSTATNFWKRVPFVTLQVSTDWPTGIIL